MPAVRAPAPAQRVLLVGWDGADWKIASPLIDAGELPQLANIVQHGAAGPLASLPPYLSPMLWNSIATGKYADQHGIVGFASIDPHTGALQAMQSTQRRCKALWNILSEHNLIAHVVGWFASHPAENVTGICVSEAFPRPVRKNAPWPLAPAAVHPPELAAEFAELRLRPEDVDPHLLRLFIPRLEEIDLAKDKRPEQLAIRLAELYSVHNAAIAALERGPCDFLGVYYHFIDWVCHDFMDFHPPRRAHVAEREFEWYRDVVNSAYRLQDILLRDLLSHAGSNTTVVLCSDHGFHSDARRPARIPMVSAGIAVWHRAQGLFAAAGPGIARDTLVSGATVLDVAPTVLHLLGLPVADDMDGRVITSALAAAPPLRKIASYETDPGPHPRPRHGNALGAADQQMLLEQFAALGYVDLADTGPESAAARNDCDNRWNLAITLRHAGKHSAAFAVLEQLHLDRPEDARYAFHLAMCQAHLGLLAEALETAETILDFTPGNAQAHRLLAELALACSDPTLALAHLEAVGSSTDANDHALRATAELALGRVLESAASFRAGLEADDENPSAWLGYAQALLRAGHIADAEACARQAIALAPVMAMGHQTLGVALALQNKVAPAQDAFARALELNPRLAVADRALQRLRGQPFVAEMSDFGETLGSPAESDRHRAESAERRAAHQATIEKRRAATTPLAFRPRPAHGKAATVAPPGLFVIVSGLPRSGTSLMMQMLARGGLPAMTDRRRVADTHNPEGYFEWEDIRHLPRDPELIARAAGHAIKVVSPLLPYLPTRHRYKIIFMRRPASEIARSQHRMISSSFTEGPPPTREAMEPVLAQHAETTLAALRTAAHIDLLTVDYPQLVADPEEGARQVALFLGPDVLPNPGAMPAAVRPDLHRERTTQP